MGLKEFSQLLIATAVAVASFLACNHLLIGDLENLQGVNGRRIFTTEELAQYKGTSEQPNLYYLAILGSIYDVSAGSFYKAKGGYEFFCGRDASRAFVSGNFTGDGLTDNLTGFTPEQFAGVYGWKVFYDDHNDYYFVGVLQGLYYTAEGERTAALDEVDEMVALSERNKQDKKDDQTRFKTCNSKWTQNTGTIVYCKNDLVPRRLVRLNHPVFPEERCTCATKDQWEKNTTGLVGLALLYRNF
jgi:predicted heme/steroid binding protein